MPVIRRYLHMNIIKSQWISSEILIWPILWKLKILKRFRARVKYLLLKVDIIFLAKLRGIFTYRIFSIKRPGVYFKLDLVDSAFIWSRRLIRARRLLKDRNFLSIFQIDLLLPISDQGAVSQGGAIFLFVLLRKTVPGSPKLIITQRYIIADWRHWHGACQ